jgi:hypothetical protein
MMSVFGPLTTASASKLDMPAAIIDFRFCAQRSRQLDVIWWLDMRGIEEQVKMVACPRNQYTGIFPLDSWRYRVPAVYAYSNTMKSMT